MTLTLKIESNFLRNHSGLWCCITISNLVTKESAFQKKLSGQTVIEILNLCYDHDLEHSNPIFSQDIPPYNDVPSNKIRLQKDQKFRRSSRNSHILIIWALTVTLTLKKANQFLSRHSDLSWCMNIPGLVTKGWVTQKISGRNTNRHSDSSTTYN